MKQKLLFLWIVFLSIGYAIAVANPVIKRGNNHYDFVKVINPLMKTIVAFTDSDDVYYTGTGYHTGVLAFIVQLAADSIPNDYVSPQSSFLTSSMGDVYCNTVKRDKQDMEDFFGDLEYVKSATNSWSSSFSLHRGGRYVLTSNIDVLAFSYRDTIDVLDEPSLQVLGYPVKTGSDLDMTGYYNTGYPYDPSSYTDREYGKYTVYFVVNDSTVQKIASDQKILTMKDSSKPLLAGLDSVQIHLDKPKVGLYKVVFESDWKYGNKTSYIAVEDTLRATAKLDKDDYVLGVDSASNLHLTIDYMYPHIHATKKDSIPTILVITRLLDRDDSLIIRDDSLATKDLLYATDIAIPFSGVTDSVLMAHNDTLNLLVEVIFDDAIRYSKVLPCVIKHHTVGIHGIAAENSVQALDIYSVYGVRCRQHRHLLSPGIYVIDGKKIVIK